MQRFLLRIPPGAVFSVVDMPGHPPQEVDALLHLTEVAKIFRAKPRPMNSNGDLWEVAVRTSSDAINFAFASAELREAFPP